MKKHLLVLPFIIIYMTGITDCDGQQIMDGSTQPHFINELPIIPRVDATGGGALLNVKMEETTKDLGVVDSLGNPLLTKVWGYNFGDGAEYPGKTIIAKSNVPVEVQWVNELRNGYLFPVDTTIMWALSGMPGLYNPSTRTPVPAVTHLHGAHTESISDGLAEGWFTPDFADRGMDFLKTDDGTNTGNPIPYHYDNDQPGATLWYHDHALGVDRLSVYSGLEGMYLLRDDQETALINSDSLPSGAYEIELELQDKMFTTDGQLYYPSDPEEAGQPAVSIHPEFFGDFILVNGKTWPKLEVEPRPYRFRIVNAGDSRFYNLFLTDKKKEFTQIGTDGGLFEAPVTTKELLLGPAQRADIVIDFSNMIGDTIVFRNDAHIPFPGGDETDEETRDVMAFIVSKPLDANIAKAVLPAHFQPLAQLPAPTVTRQLVLFEVMDEFGRIKPSLGTAKDGVMAMDDAATETPTLNSTEMWEIFNATDDAHPIHLHLVRFQVVNTQDFDADIDTLTGALSNIQLKGPAKAPAPIDAGWKDTAPMYPGQVTRIVATFDRAGKYMWHCHILSHEDHEMMRPLVITEATSVAAENNLSAKPSLLLEQNFPNPFNDVTSVNFSLPTDEQVDLSVYNMQGNKVAELINQFLPMGSHSVNITSEGLAAGLYYYSLQTHDRRINKKMEVMR